jgi:hypothetical protein
MDNEAKIEELKNALRQIMMMVTERGKPLGEDLKMVLADVMQHVASRIQQLRQEGSPAEGMPPIGAPEPELNEGMPSSNIAAFGYDKDSGRLLVQFLGKYPNRQGGVYAYEGVPKQIFDLFRKGAVPARTNGQNRWGKWWKGKVPSAGASMYTLIKEGGYPYKKLS